ncbi:MAG: hypothetical protein J5472_06350 [Clostridia bacterium]|nr:hypothetical protein [Clostridia bacterium]
MYQGTTPSITLTIAGRDLSGCTVEVYIAQAAVRIVKRDARVEADAEGTTVACALTQKETLSLTPGPAFVQVRWIDAQGTAEATDEAQLNVKRILDRTVIEYAGGEGDE